MIKNAFFVFFGTFLCSKRYYLFKNRILDHFVELFLEVKVLKTFNYLFKKHILDNFSKGLGSCSWM